MEHLFIVNTWFAQALNQYCSQLLFFKKLHTPFLHFVKCLLAFVGQCRQSPVPTHCVHSMTVNMHAGWPFLDSEPFLEDSVVCK